MRAVIYNTTTGEILRSVEGPSDHISIQAGIGEYYVLSNVATDKSYYFDTNNGWLSPKGDYELNALPIPCVVTIEGTEYSCDEQPTLTFDEPGVYDVSVDAGVQYLKKTFQVEQL